ncbi:agamous-like MADS-box protein AGL80 [Senna tora]|uniref:Agamous-like MADS-box protein AGL80 n=1 Tax=Senna tora TaxID=362788 RepID=A0A834TG18_9FABA|nr:agamous-like MADS-box protein AGL80 [Senna tora]
MGRQKVKLEYITDDLKRKASFRKRKENVVKKTNELNILCDVDATAIIYSGHSADSHPQVWPDDGGVHRFLNKYHGRSVLEKTLNQEGLIQQRLHKEREHLKKRSNENKDEEISQLMINYMGGLMEASGKEDDEVYVPAPPMSEEGLLLNGGNENDQINLHHHGMGSRNWNSPSSCWNNLEDLEYYIWALVHLKCRKLFKMPTSKMLLLHPATRFILKN